MEFVSHMLVVFYKFKGYEFVIMFPVPHTPKQCYNEFILGSTSHKQGVAIPIFMNPLACALACE